MKKRFIKSALFVAAGAIFFISCSKSDSIPGPTPIPAIKPDTLSTGWTKVNVSVTDTFLGDIFFNSSTTGYVVGDNIYKSTDGGNTWTNIKAASINNLFVTPNGTAYFVPYNYNPLYRTSDGGATFSTYSFSGISSTDIFFSDDNTGYCIGSNIVYKTTDAGTTWNSINSTGITGSGSGYSTIFCLNPNKFWVANGSGFFRSTTPGVWQQANVTGAVINAAPPSIYASSANIIYVGNGPNLFKSTDGGVNYSLIKQFSEYGFTDVHFLDDQNGYVSTARTIYKTIDGGVNWTKVVSLGQGYIGEIHFIDATHGWACGYDGQGHGIVLTFRN